ncbi:UPF0280 family protein [Thalassovita taeanensis]|uniref:Uncharacterized protein n=1 Tax=Thalassovita taeanensis TaxID=657014 RepID=A0A1H9AL38_9RHOB|nr:UPF0280 family protein [Thalassovita taeanensis]SEP76658.1 hypothetical protein SAMN04488092_102157 [Thalassovita taeanensis]
MTAQMGPQAVLLPDGRRLHLNHGPIDLIVGAEGDGAQAAQALATARFQTVLQELVAELPALRRPVDTHPFDGSIARKMQAATVPFSPGFITPMAAVAGAVADEVLEALAAAPGLTKAYVNNGGDVAFFMAAGQSVTAAMAEGRVTIDAAAPWCGLATSGWRGRSHSLGIADAVSVVARSAALADAAATMIANAVDLPDHPAVTRTPAHDLAPDSDLGARPVTVDVGSLTADEAHAALDRGTRLASDLLRRGLIGGACLSLNTFSQIVGAAFIPLSNRPETYHA